MKKLLVFIALCIVLSSCTKTGIGQMYRKDLPKKAPATVKTLKGIYQKVGMVVTGVKESRPFIVKYGAIDSVGDMWCGHGDASTTKVVKGDYDLVQFVDHDKYNPHHLGVMKVTISKNPATYSNKDQTYKGNGTWVVKEASGVYKELLGAAGILKYTETHDTYNEEENIYYPGEYEMTLGGYVKK